MNRSRQSCGLIYSNLLKMRFENLIKLEQIANNGILAKLRRNDRLNTRVFPIIAPHYGIITIIGGGGGAIGYLTTKLGGGGGGL